MKKMDHDLSVLRQQVIDMGNLTEQMVLQAVDLISFGENRETINQVLDEEARLDQMQLEIDKEAVRLLTVYSPVAGDLRLILSISRITAELERIGDHAVNMCESLHLMISKDQLQVMPEVQKMGNVVKTMVSDALNSFVQSDIFKAKATIASDNMVDALNDQVVGELLSLEVVRKMLNGPSEVAGALAQILIARSLERIADQATNISEEVVYMVQGDDIRHQPSAEGLTDAT